MSALLFCEEELEEVEPDDFPDLELFVLPEASLPVASLSLEEEDFAFVVDDFDPVSEPLVLPLSFFDVSLEEEGELELEPSVWLLLLLPKLLLEDELGLSDDELFDEFES